MAEEHLVAPAVVRAKFERELAGWRQNAESYRRRGWLLVGQGELHVDVAFTAKATLVGQVVDVVCATVRFEFSNYDLWAPSVTFIDVAAETPWLPPMRAVMQTADGPRDLLIDRHPGTGLPFLCVPGTREYHSHPQHSGDDWLLHRGAGEGRLASLCDLIWRTMALNVVGLQVAVQTLPDGQCQVQARLLQGELAPQVPA